MWKMCGAWYTTLSQGMPMSFPKAVKHIRNDRIQLFQVCFSGMEKRSVLKERIFKEKILFIYF